jgi:hypothetical protein
MAMERLTSERLAVSVTGYLMPVRDLLAIDEALAEIEADADLAAPVS